MNCSENPNFYNETFYNFIFPFHSWAPNDSSPPAPEDPIDRQPLVANDVVAIVVLALLNMAIVVGNALVITAVFTHRKLRKTTTNRFIVSLAVADLTVGIFVLPFSSVNEASHAEITSQSH